MMYFLAHEFAGLRARRFAFAPVSAARAMVFLSGMTRFSFFVVTEMKRNVLLR